MATRLAGILVVVTVAANAFSYSRFPRKNLRPFKSPIDDSADLLAVFKVRTGSDGGGASVESEDEFFFGLATAPAHVEDRLNDAWLQFAAEKPCDIPESQEGGQNADPILASGAGDGGSPQAPVIDRSTSARLKR